MAFVVDETVAPRMLAALNSGQTLAQIATTFGCTSAQAKELIGGLCATGAYICANATAFNAIFT
jgi:hypothetical protein